MATVSGDPLVGTVARVVRNKGYAFVNVGEESYFLHGAELFETEFTALQEGDAVEFFPARSTKGLRAVNARKIWT